MDGVDLCENLAEVDATVAEWFYHPLEQQRGAFRDGEAETYFYLQIHFCAQNVVGVFGGERQLPHKHLVEGYPSAVHIRDGTILLAHMCFWGLEGETPHIILISDEGSNGAEAEIADLDVEGWPVEENVLGFDVPVDNGLLFQENEGRCDLCEF